MFENECNLSSVLSEAKKLPTNQYPALPKGDACLSLMAKYLYMMANLTKPSYPYGPKRINRFTRCP